MAKPKKNDIITFKIDETLKEIISGVDNRSEFIRQAILNSVEKQCPLCQGSGILPEKYKSAWTRIAVILEQELGIDMSNHRNCDLQTENQSVEEMQEDST